MRIPEYPYPEHDTMDDHQPIWLGPVAVAACVVLTLAVSAGFITAALAEADAQLARIDTVKQEHFVAQPRSIASARNDVRL